ncbi:MAG TPA: DUF3368 domain-containing protein [Verrucomicrobiales bacterium]|nr:DUF3368 domain-containing protein [Verrucomicrobiales bacterium]
MSELQAKEAGDAVQIADVLSHATIISGLRAPDPLLIHELDTGEASVIHAARIRGVGQVLIDERKARRIASTVYCLEVRGTCALLVEAKRRSLISTVKPPLEAMRAGGYFIGPMLVAECLRRAGE